jgi:hypothetical protein
MIIGYFLVVGMKKGVFGVQGGSEKRLGRRGR